MDNIINELNKYLYLYKGISIRSSKYNYVSTSDEVIGYANNMILVKNSDIIDSVSILDNSLFISFTPFEKLPEIVEIIETTNPEVMTFYNDIISCNFSNLPFYLVMMIVKHNIWIGDIEVYNKFKI